MIARTDDVVINCVKAVYAEIPPLSFFVWDSWDFWQYYLKNLLYNAGFMFTDVLDLVFYDPSDKNPYWYYFFFRVGDFFIRIFFRDTTQDI